MFTLLLLLACARDVEDVLDADPFLTALQEDADALCAEEGGEVWVPGVWTASVLRDIDVHAQGAREAWSNEGEPGDDCYAGNVYACFWSFERGDIWAPSNVGFDLDCETGEMGEGINLAISTARRHWDLVVEPQLQ